MEDYTALDEVVKGYVTPSLTVKLSYKQIEETIRQPVTKTCECSFQFILVDGTRVVPVVTSEGRLPVRDILP